MGNILVVLLTALLFSGHVDAGVCSAIESEAERNSCFSEAYRANAPLAKAVGPGNAVSAYLANRLVDPTSARNYQVSVVVPCRKVSKLGLDCVCYRLDAKNRDGHYVGPSTRFAQVVTFNHERNEWLVSETGPASNPEACWPWAGQPASIERYLPDTQPGLKSEVTQPR